MFSIITTDPSTTMPKSSAPSESRFAGMWLTFEADGREQQGERNGERNDDRAAHISQKEKENDRNQNHAFGEVVLNGFDRELAPGRSDRERERS